MPGTEVEAQWLILLQGIGAGFVLGIFWGILRPIRLIFKNAVKTVFLTDFVFSVASSLFFFFFSFYNTQGNIRFYVFSAFLVGWLLCRIPADRLFFPCELKIAEKLREKIKKYQKKIKKNKIKHLKTRKESCIIKEN